MNSAKSRTMISSRKILILSLMSILTVFYTWRKNIFIWDTEVEPKPITIPATNKISQKS